MEWTRSKEHRHRSPNGINPKTGVFNPSDDQDEVYLIIATSKVAEIMGLADHNVSSYDLYVRKTAENRLLKSFRQICEVKWNERRKTVSEMWTTG